jgi:hypothetical protein
MPTARTSTRRRQYVACEIVAGRGRAPPGGSAFARRFWSIPVTMEDSHRMSLKARRKKASSAHASSRVPRRRGRGTAGHTTGESARLPTVPAPGGNGGWSIYPTPFNSARRHSAAGRHGPRRVTVRLVVELALKPKNAPRVAMHWAHRDGYASRMVVISASANGCTYPDRAFQAATIPICRPSRRGPTGRLPGAVTTHNAGRGCRPARGSRRRPDAHI